MKKKILFVITFFIAIGLLSFAEKFDIEEHAVDVYVDGELLDTYDEVQDIEIPAFLYNGRTMLPLRKTFELFGIYDDQIEWQESESSVTVVTNEGNVLWIQIDNPIMKLNGISVETDVPAKLFNSRTFVPLAIISSMLGEDPIWHAEEGFVSMTPSVFKIEELKMSYELSRQEGYTVAYYESLLDEYIVKKIDSQSNESVAVMKFNIVKTNFVDVIVETAKENYISSEAFTLIKSKENAYYWQEKDNVFHVILAFGDKTLQIKTYDWTFEMIENWLNTVEEVK